MNSQQEEENDIYHEGSYVPLQKTKISKKEPPGWERMYEPIDWKILFEHQEYLSNGINYYRTTPKSETRVLCFHGAGHSALVYGQLAKQLRNQVLVLAYDLLQHGSSNNDSPLSIENLVEEGIMAFQAFQEKYPGKYIFVGHSLGGSIATRVANKLKNEKIVGVIMIDTIEGAALRSQKQMKQFLTERPQQFKSLQSAIHWHIKANCLRRNESARFSIPSQLVKKGQKYAWKVNLLQTTDYWHDWFYGLSQMFLDLNCKKLLLTTTKFRLDEVLMNGLKEDKFQLCIFQHSGHNIHEDEYEKVGRILIGSFIQQ